MKRRAANRFLWVLILFAARPLTGLANQGMPFRHFYIDGSLVGSVSDSIPVNKKSPGQSDSQVPASAVKEVPKARKQIKPMAVPATTTIKPVQIIKPKIIKPVVRIR
jgi:hypothetical protein